jgi:hypothetical protein
MGSTCPAAPRAAVGPGHKEIRSRVLIVEDEEAPAGAVARGPVDAFWSPNMYDASDFYLVADPVGLYWIGDRTEGLKYGADGSSCLPPAIERVE